MTEDRLHITQSVLTKAGVCGLDKTLLEGETLSDLIGFMAHHSATASGKGGRNKGRRRYGHFVLVVRDAKVVDLIAERGDWCRECLGAKVSTRGIAINCKCA